MPGRVSAFGAWVAEFEFYLAGISCPFFLLAVFEGWCDCACALWRLVSASMDIGICFGGLGCDWLTTLFFDEFLRLRWF